MNTMQIVKRGRPPTRRILTPAENKGLRKEIAMDNKMMTETNENYAPFDSLPYNNKRLAIVNKTMAQGQQDSLSQSQKTMFEKEKAELMPQLQRMMVPKSHIGLAPQKGGVQSMEFRKAANSMAKEEMSSKFQQLAERWKYVCRELGHEDDANLESIRPDTR